MSRARLPGALAVLSLFPSLLLGQEQEESVGETPPQNEEVAAETAAQPTPEGILASLIEAGRADDAIAIELALLEARRLGRVAFGDILTGSKDVPSPFELGALLRLLATFGDERDIERTLELTQVPYETGLEAREDGTAPEPELVREWEDLDLEQTLTLEELERQALVAILQREPAAFDELERLVRVAPAEHVSVAISAVGTVGGERALTWLVESLDALPEHELVLLSRARRVAQDLRPPFDESVLAPMRARLHGENRTSLRLAASIYSLLGDFDSTERLIELHASEDPGLAAMGRDALERLTGLQLSDAQRWSEWLTGERAWMEESAEQALEDLESLAPQRVRHALHEIAMHRLERDYLALEVANVLWRPEPDLRQEACSVLWRLGSRAAVPSLIHALEDEDEAVSVAAWAALRAIEGVELPRDSQVWALHLSGRS